MTEKRLLNWDLFLNKKTIISFLVSFSILFFLLKYVDIEGVIEVSRNANIGIFCLAIIVHYASFLVRGLRWQNLLRGLNIKISIGVSSEMVFLSWFANSIVPAKIGDVYRSHMLKMYNGTPISVSIGTLVVERLFDILLLMLLLTITGLTVFKDKMPEEIMQSIEIGYLLLGVIALCLVFFYVLRHHIGRIIPERFMIHYSNLHDGLYSSLSNPATLVSVAVFTIFSWTFESARFLFVTRSLGIELSLAAIIFVVLASSLLTAIPLTPAGLGAVEVSIVFILGILGVDPTVAASVALLDRLISYWSILVSGAVVHMLSDKS
ncbi:lysylphosphatidylglycerol synthase transmembrane domain-containing protein [Methanococcoides burtonii]|uniref:Flippase-like domain-containing protein n=1 Tax=Methanococcoides burtonii (strain DSM 6242 / NBRC 107633 / OCM 468 / ACE-M) TaxID=259564 RepID=Q12VK8_METBU|nr:lysylphosphatidylglycerol synthase transmembrane domain-containing protein [Methanococcoides burtonii]ABE52518.1 protein of unknown function UPF0104 [Methanococcoides burtonii DSM 6242]